MLFGLYDLAEKKRIDVIPNIKNLDEILETINKVKPSLSDISATHPSHVNRIKKSVKQQTENSWVSRIEEMDKEIRNREI